MNKTTAVSQKYSKNDYKHYLEKRMLSASILVMACLGYSLVEAEEKSVEINTPSTSDMKGQGVLAPPPDNGLTTADLSAITQNAISPIEKVDPSEFQSPLSTENDIEHWLRFTSGEWLRGDMIELRRDKITFDSIRVKEKSYDWDKVSELYIPTPVFVTRTNNSVHIGPVRLKDNEVLVGGITPTSFPSYELQALAMYSDNERNLWRGKIGIGLSARQGNSVSRDYSSSADLTRRSAKTRINITYNGVFSSTQGVETANSHRATLGFNYYPKPSYFYTPLNFDGLKDKFQNIQLQTITGIGGGYDLIDNDIIEWIIEGGLGYRQIEYVSVAAGNDRIERDAAINFGTTLDWELTSDIDWKTSFTATDNLPDWDNGQTKFQTVFEFEVNDDLDINFAFYWDYLANPKPREDGTTPVKNDYRTAIELAYDF